MGADRGGRGARVDGATDAGDHPREAIVDERGERRVSDDEG